MCKLVIFFIINPYHAEVAVIYCTNVLQKTQFVITNSLESEMRLNLCDTTITLFIIKAVAETRGFISPLAH